MSLPGPRPDNLPSKDVQVIQIQGIAEFHGDEDGVMTPVKQHPDPYHNPFGKDCWSIVLSPNREYTHAIVPGESSQLNPYNIFENGSLFFNSHRIDKSDQISAKVQARVMDELHKFLFNQRHYMHILVELQLGESGLLVRELKGEGLIELEDGSVVRAPLQIDLDDHWRRELGWVGSEDPQKAIQRARHFTLSQVKNFTGTSESIYEWSHEIGRWIERASNYAVTMDDVTRSLDMIGEIGARLKEDLVSQQISANVNSAFHPPEAHLNMSSPLIQQRFQDQVSVHREANTIEPQARVDLKVR